MKSGVDIKLTEIHRGECWTVVTLGLNGKDPAQRFFLKLLKDDSKRFESLRTRITTVSNYENYENELTFRHVGQGVYEFKRPGIRLYAFYDQIDSVGHLILCTNGGTKNKKKEQQADIALAKQRKEAYFAAKTVPSTDLTYQEIDL